MLNLTYEVLYNLSRVKEYLKCQSYNIHSIWEHKEDAKLVTDVPLKHFVIGKKFLNSWNLRDALFWQ